MKPFSNLQEDLRKWFSKTDPEGDWKRINSKGEAIGPCAREPGEPKPKCMSAEKRASLTKKERASAVRAKRKHDPNPERKGEPINVSNFGKGKISEHMENLNEKNEPTNPELWSRAKSLARSKFDVYPSAYANGWASKWYKGKGGSWKTVSEEKEESEYDYEGDMARGQLQSIINNAQRVHDMLKDKDNLPEWVQSKITLSEDYISTVANYLMSEVDESVEPVNELSSDLLGRYKKKAGEQASTADKAGNYAKGNKRFSGIMKATKKQFANDMKKVNEGFAETLVHKDKANAAYESGDSHAFHGHMVDHHVAMADFHRQHGDDNTAQKHEEKAKEHHSNMQTYYREGVDYIDEKLSVAPGQAPRQQGRFAPNNQTRIDKTPTGGRIFTGTYFTGTKKPSAAALAVQATARERLKKMKEEVGSLEEGRPSQRHPLEGHEYHKKTNAELEYIAKDAHKAAEAMKSHNTTAENKYRDQANDSATVRHFRKTSGTPDWYKKKYGHMKEAFKPMDEPNYNNSIQARQKKADDNKPPFDGPYKKSTGVVTDKSGAKHGGMSIARNLAKQAMKKQASKMSVKEDLQESRKAEIVKEIMKKGKKKEDNTFQAEPEITTTVVKADN